MMPEQKLQYPKCAYCGRFVLSNPDKNCPEGVYGGIDFRLDKIVCGECCGAHPQWKKDIEEWERRG